MKRLLIPLIIAVFFSSCIKEVTDTIDKTRKINSVTWSPELAIPLVYSHLRILDTAESAKFIRIEDDGSLTAFYADQIYSKSAEEVIPLEDQSMNEVINLNNAQLALLNSAGQVNINYTRDISLNYSGNEVDRILFKGGDIQFNVSSTLQHNVLVRIKVPDAAIQGVSFNQGLAVNYAGSTPVLGSTMIGLDGYDVDFTQTGQGHSELKLEFEITLTKQGNNPIGPTETIDIDFNFINQQFREIHGFFNSLDLSNGGEDIKVNVYEGENAGNFTIADPSVKMIFGNSMGIDIDATITQFDGISKENNTVSLTGYPSPLPIPTPDIAQKGMMLHDSFELDKDNSNIVDYVNNKPNTNNFDVMIVTNPAGPSIRNWFIDTSRIEVDAEIVLPFYGTANGYKIQSESDFEMDVEDNESIEEVLFRIHTENGFPIDASIQIYFEDSISNTIIDSLFVDDDLILPSGNIDGNGKVISVNPKTMDVLVDADRMDQLRMANRTRMVAELQTTTVSGSQPDVKIFKEYEILLQLGMQAKLNLTEGR